MERLWAPWRNAYVVNKKPSRSCLFCRAHRSSPKEDPKNLVLLRARHSFVIFNRYPYNNGHLMVTPNRHVASLDQLTDPERLDLLRLLDRSLSLLKKTFRPAAFNVGINLGRMAGAGVPNHVHLHVVPRWAGDTNFMPVLTGTKVISDSLQSAYRKLRKNLSQAQ